MSPASKPSVEGRELVRALWRLVRIYWTSPDAKWGALLLAGTTALQLGGVYANVLVSVAQRDVGNSLGARDAASFSHGIWLLIVFMLLSVVVPAYADWIQQRLRLRWRRGLTAHYLERWISPQAYCQADLHRQQLDNPDVRIAEDVRDFVGSACGLSLSLLSAVVTLVSFAAMLWNISAEWAIPIAGRTRQIPGLLLWVAVAFSLLSMWITHLVGRRLVPLNYDKIRLEADFRYGLVRYRDHVEAVALSRGEAVERIGAVGRFLRVYDNFCQLVGAQRTLSILTQGIGVANTLVPLVAAGLAYFADVLTLGVIAQTRYAYGQVAGSLAWFVNAYQEIARWRANIERLTAFSAAIDATQREFERAGIRIERTEPDAIRLEGLRVEAPRGRVLIDGANASVAAGERVAIAGPAGTGRTMLMRALAGIWPFGAGRIAEPPREQMLFLAQQPYWPIGSLRAVVSYPSAPDTFSDERIREALRLFGLDALTARLDQEEPWDQELSPHEQQRLALARVLLQDPAWVLLDEATSSLDAASEAKAYELLTQRLPRAALIAVAERPGVLPYLTRRWTLTANDRGGVALDAA
jgi:putative ATP-binding cassette transporter